MGRALDRTKITAFDSALEYALRHDLHALVIAEGAQIVFEHYVPDESSGIAPHALYSGTKSFWGILATAAQEDGLIELDEPVAATFPGWQTDPCKRRVTLRNLLSLTSGIGFGGLGNAVPTYDQALEVEIKNEPGTVFTYGGVPLQVFGAVLVRKLAPKALTPHAYLRERVLEPIGLQIGDWRRLKDGTQPLPTGAFVAAREWLKFGRYIASNWSRFAACFVGSAANPRYGLGWWLQPAGILDQVVYASGSGGQALYIIPSRNLIAVHFGKSPSWKHETFLKRLLL